jgi:hypothetical protein
VVKGVAELRAHRPCDDFSIQAITPFDALAGGGGRGLGEKGRLKPPTSVPIAAAPGGAPLARLVPSRSVSEAMVVMERRSGWTRIGVEFTDLAIVGWVPAASVLSPGKRVEDTEVLGGLGLSGSASTLTKAITCDHDVRLVAQAGKLRRIVGTLGAGVQMETAPADAGFARVTLDEVKPVNGAKLLVGRADLDGCGAAPSGERDRPHRRRE